MGAGVRAARVWRTVLGVEHTVIEGIDLEQVGSEEVLVAGVRPASIDRAAECRAPPPNLVVIHTLLPYTRSP